MNNLKSRFPKWLAIAFLQFLFMGCAMGQKMVFHSFSFDARGESPDIEVLDWQYGAKNEEYDAEHQTGVRARKSQVEAGIPDPSGGAAGVIPVGDFLYVKWRVKQTGEIHEDKVDLTKRLPHDMKYYALHFVIKGPQLYIYLIPPIPPRTPPFNDPEPSQASWDPGVYRKSFTDPRYAEYLKKHQIYPN